MNKRPIRHDFWNGTIWNRSRVNIALVVFITTFLATVEYLVLPEFPIDFKFSYLNLLITQRTLVFQAPPRGMLHDETQRLRGQLKELLRKKCFDLKKMAFNYNLKYKSAFL